MIFSKQAAYSVTIDTNVFRMRTRLVRFLNGSVNRFIASIVGLDYFLCNSKWLV